VLGGRHVSVVLAFEPQACAQSRPPSDFGLDSISTASHRCSQSTDTLRPEYILLLPTSSTTFTIMADQAATGGGFGAKGKGKNADMHQSDIEMGDDDHTMGDDDEEDEDFVS
jgi:hypothetical protein